MFSKTTQTLATGVLGGLSALVAPNAVQGAMVTDNRYITDSATPLVVTDNGPSDYSIPGIRLSNPSGEISDFRLTLPVSLFDLEGSPLSQSQSAGKLLIRLMDDPATRFNYTALKGAPAAGEKDILVNLPAVDQNNTVFGGSLNYGTVTFDLRGAAVEDGQSTFAAFQFIPSNGASAIFFLNDGLDQTTGAIIPGVDSAWVTTQSFTGNLANSDEYGANRTLAVRYETIAVPEPAMLGVSVVMLGGLMLRPVRKL